MSEFDTEFDVIVAGSGGGIAGAYTAAREGLSVLLVEATDMFGGTTAYSGGGGVWYPCNPVLQRAGTDDIYRDSEDPGRRDKRDIGPARIGIPNETSKAADRVSACDRPLTSDRANQLSTRRAVRG